MNKVPVPQPLFDGPTSFIPREEVYHYRLLYYIALLIQSLGKQYQLKEKTLSTVVLSIGIGKVPSIIDVWGYDRDLILLFHGLVYTLGSAEEFHVPRC